MLDEKSPDELEAEIKELEAENSDLTDQVAALEKEAADLTVEVDDLKGKIADFEAHDLADALKEAINVDEFVDLIAEAARTSRHAAAAYQMLRSIDVLHLPTLAARQSMIIGRMKDAA